MKEDPKITTLRAKKKELIRNGKTEEAKKIAVQMSAIRNNSLLLT